jgi:capsular polysaccharide biosynthesis protein
MFGHPLKQLFRHWKQLVLVGLLAALFVAGVTLLFPREYRADAQVLIISKTRFGVDPYTVVKSAERVGENIAQVMHTNDFFEKVMNQQGFSIDKSRFENVPERKKRKRWNKTIQPSVVYGTGILNISTYGRDSQQAMQLASASVDALVAHAWEYVGSDVAMKVVNDPVVTRWPARPSILVNAALGFILGASAVAWAVAKK